MAASLIIKPHEKDLGGGFVVRRSLPAAAQRSVGPFIFFDHFGPVSRKPSDNFDVRPHPHIGLATVTYLFEGAMMHRDTLGYAQRIEPGAINWMTAGKGIAHSERGPEDLNTTPYRIHGLQLWAALPLAEEECEPSFAHTPASAIPVYNENLFSARVLIGSAFGLTSPVETFSETLYIDFQTQPCATILLPVRGGEYAIYSVDGDLEIDGEKIGALQLAVLDLSRPVTITSDDSARFVMLGGAPLDAYRHMWWNFVSSRKERIEQAKDDWRAQGFGTVPGETEFIPLPEH
ncbi:MAG TPA: pirin family protein [Spongiibacteraceae bacterium]|nr:pirin family protein [Spongiibacteraceae bacterium]